jgi:hypothetical protein
MYMYEIVNYYFKSGEIYESCRISQKNEIQIWYGTTKAVVVATVQYLQRNPIRSYKWILL